MIKTVSKLSGIGLAVVEEVIRVNNANIKVDSIIGEGSTFIVSFEKSTDEQDCHLNDENQQRFLVNQLIKDASNLQSKKASEKQHNLPNNLDTVLIIDDNADMRAHIGSILEPHYHCFFAATGQQGMALAIEQIPDVIICDVMMPEMDGFQVSRNIRADSHTSHIPLILLTALNDKSSKIRGWREHVDVYLTKPFDSDELKLQLENIIVIRNIINKKAGQTLTKEHTSSNTDLSEVDQQFIDKVHQLIANNYHNPLYLRPQLANDMAVSVKQLQRKTKALIDINPMDLLRSYRLKQATKLLKAGHQASVVSDQCGFNSLSYFSQCFKAQYGLSPKNYQNTCRINL